MGFLSKLFKSYSEKEVGRVMPIVEKINSLEPTVEKLTDAELRAKTDEFKSRLQKGKTLDDILPEAFAIVREASKRVLRNETFRCSINRWNNSSPRKNCRNENR